MLIRRVHWLTACTIAIFLHAAVLFGLRSQSAGQSSPPPGPKIELAASIAGVIGSPVESTEVVAADTTVQVSEPDATEVLEPIKPEALTPVPANTTPDEAVVSEAVEHDKPAVLEPAKPDKLDVTEPVKPVQTTNLKPAKPEAQISQPVIKKKPGLTRKKKRQSRARKKKRKRVTETQKRKRKQARPSKRGDSRRGTAGVKRGGGGKSRAIAGAVERYASLVRARILSRRPDSGGRHGSAVVSFQLSRSGGLSWARISRSSGNRTLDKKALGSVRRSSPFPRPPTIARAGELRFSISFRFR